MRTYFQFDIS